MKQYLRENPTITFGLGLPLLLVIAFMLISGIPALLVDAPLHDVLYATDYYNQQNGVQIAVINRKVQVVYRGNSLGYQNPRLWRYNPKTGAVQEIAILVPPGLAPPTPGVITPATEQTITPISVADLADLTVDPSSIAPDGYEFTSGASDYSRDMFTGMFYSQRYGAGAALTKSGRSIRLPHAGTDYSSTYTRLVGWVVAP